MLLPLPQC